MVTAEPNLRFTTENYCTVVGGAIRSPIPKRTVAALFTGRLHPPVQNVFFQRLMLDTLTPITGATSAANIPLPEELDGHTTTNAPVRRG